MMNASSTDDDFGENPFRMSPNDFYETNPSPVAQQQFQRDTEQQFPQQGETFGHTDPQSGFPSTPGLTGSMMPQQQQVSHMEPQASRGCWGTFLMLIDLNTYKTYFDVDAEDIVARVRAVCLDFYKPEHFRNNVLGAQQTNGLKGPDLYGPFWVTMTLIFLVGVTSNMHAYLHRSDVEVFEYDINHLMHAASVFSTFSFLLPAVFWVTCKCMNMEALSLVEWECLFGYSLVPFVPAVLLCVIPFAIFSWVFPLGATLVSCSLVVRNVSAPMLSTDAGRAKAPPVILAILASYLIFFFIIKFTFYTHRK